MRELIGERGCPTPVVADPAAPEGEGGAERQSGFASQIAVRTPPAS